jgi:hypothetical protein
MSFGYDTICESLGEGTNQTLQIYTNKTSFHLFINGDFYDVNLANNPIRQKNKYPRREFDY